MSALSLLAKDCKVSVVENISLSTPKTKEFASILADLKLNNGRKTLLVTGSVDKNIVLSARNIQRVSVATPVALNTHDLLNTDTLLLSEDGLSALEQLYTTAE